VLGGVWGADSEAVEGLVSEFWARANAAPTMQNVRRAAESRVEEENETLGMAQACFPEY
jgi:hypothetical protein